MVRLVLAPALLAAVAALPAAAPADEKKPEANITWKKTVLDTKFRSEGVAVADVNKDGKVDVLNGEYWYEAPDWKPHELQPPADFKDGLGNYSRVFNCWSDDFNGDGFPDLLVIDHPGTPCYWMENPKGKAAGDDGKPLHWKKHVIWHSACNETPVYADLLGTGKRVLLMAAQPKGKSNEGQMAYFTPASDPAALWEMHPVSEPSTPAKVENGKEVPGTRKEIPATQRYSHGLGMGDVNGDKRADVLCPAGWWEQPEKPDGKTPWTFHPANLGEGCADMFAFDVDGDGKNDVLTTSAHKFGIWWHKQRGGEKDANPSFQKVDLFPKLVSETHAAHFVDIDGDGRPDLVTGKRWWSHGKSEPGSDMPAMIYWLKNTKGPDGVAQFTPMPIDDDSGIGTQFVVADITGDGLLDVVTSNKKGVRVIVQQRK
ncbi:FG-GAP repeat domain-containing protein [Gemmata sp.]|uniref:FG-GAP repeat domain-containing protein n=1 Tax=Gemmata sp. TaxID=1914242 RepID=UPI003F72FA73